jgi:PAS domain S-box-containing protein
MTEVERRRRSRVRWMDRSIRSKALAVVLFPTVILAAALVASAVLVHGWATRAADLAALALALVGGTALWHFFTTGVVRRLDRLERETGELEGGGGGVTLPLSTEPTGRDEIGRLASRLAKASERDRARRELTDILAASPVVSLRYDVSSRRFSYASPNIEQLLGLGAEEAMADTDAVVGRFHPHDEHRLRTALAEGRGQGDDRLSMMLRVRADLTAQDWREVEALYSVEADGRGIPQTVSAYLVDVSALQAAQRSAEERRFMLESIFHASPDTIVVRDAAGEVLLTSSSLAEVVGAAGGTPVDPDRVIEEAYRYGRLHRDERAALDRMLARCLAGETDLDPVVTTGRAPQGRGELRTFETRARPVFDESGRITGTVTVSRDITDRMRLEHSLRRATMAAEQASEAKSQFLSRMSHELRTPLNAILGFAQLLELDQLPSEQASSVDQIQRAGQHLLSLINEVLDITRIEAGQLAVSSETVEVGGVLDEVTALLTPVAEASAVHMMVEPSTLRRWGVRADHQRLRQVLLNLGSNAVKYNEAGGTVAFRTSLAAGRHVRFSVHDTGPGIPHEQQDKLFVPFSRLGAERSGVEGTGVGLALSKQLVELMEGTIGVESAPGHGSTFWVELPGAERAEAGDEPPRTTTEAAHETLAAPEEPSAVEPQGQGPRSPAGDPREAETQLPEPHLTVLHVEDDESNAELVALVLARRPAVRLVSAVEARLGLELARQHRPQLLLLDLHLPDLSGDELLHRIKAMPELSGTKVVVVSADATAERIRRVLGLGIEGYLTKPVDVEALLQLVDDQLAHLSAANR